MRHHWNWGSRKNTLEELIEAVQRQPFVLGRPPKTTEELHLQDGDHIVLSCDWTWEHLGPQFYRNGARLFFKFHEEFVLSLNEPGRDLVALAQSVAQAVSCNAEFVGKSDIEGGPAEEKIGEMLTFHLHSAKTPVK